MPLLACLRGPQHRRQALASTCATSGAADNMEGCNACNRAASMPNDQTLPALVSPQHCSWLIQPGPSPAWQPGLHWTPASSPHSSSRTVSRRLQCYAHWACFPTLAATSLQPSCRSNTHSLGMQSMPSNFGRSRRTLWCALLSTAGVLGCEQTTPDLPGQRQFAADRTSIGT